LELSVQLQRRQLQLLHQNDHGRRRRRKLRKMGHSKTVTSTMDVIIDDLKIETLRDVDVCIDLI